ncbi:MAG: hypothetical protein GX218_09590 [Clostridiaceae bacterium]|nr:hypothetical protein [Clostridiaceae bacterium]
MERLNAIIEQLENSGVQIDWHRISGIEGYTRIHENGEVYMAVDPQLSTSRKAAVAYHEAGHFYCGLGELSDKNEFRADSWAARQLIVPEEIVQAVKDGIKNVYELAEKLDVDQEYLEHCLRILKIVRGPYIEHKQYVIWLDPITIYDRETEQFWPEEN